MQAHPHDGTPQLVTMANQIGNFFESQSPSEPEVASQAVAAHLKLFWAPTMRAQLVEQFDKGNTDGLTPIVANAVNAYRATLVNQGVHVPAEDAFVLPRGGGDAG